jgi:hypothetical protein
MEATNRDLEWSRNAVRSLLRRCARLVAGDMERMASELRRWVR